MKTSPTQRSLALLRQAGWTCHKTEQWNAFAKRRIDAYGFGDILAHKASAQGATLVQTTTGSNMMERVRKIAAIPAAVTWLLAGNHIIVHGWRKVGRKGDRKTWQVRVIDVTEEYLRNLPPVPEVVDAPTLFD